jgi:sugar O-acyltransferase (sialic acid O-acetyltransferase NeuD family)
MKTGLQVVLFGIGSPIVADYVETCQRVGWLVAAAVKNREGEVYFDDQTKVVEAGAVDAAMRACSCLCPLFTPGNRALATREAKASGFRFDATLMDPHAVISSSADVGGGTYVNAGAIVAAKVATSRHVLINRAASIGHHARIGQCASIGPGAIIGGLAVVERGATIGAGAIVLPKVKVGAFAVVGAGAVVTRDVVVGTKVVGNPARVIDSGLPEFDLPDVDLPVS